MAARAIYEPTSNLHLVAFGVDSFEGSTSGGVFSPSDGDAADFTTLGLDGDLNTRLYKHNLYGTALLGEFGGFKAELWGAFWHDTASLWAVNLRYDLPFGEDFSLGLKASYLANAINKHFKLNANAANAQLFDVRLLFKAYGFDATFGGIGYGKKDRLTLNTIEDTGSANLDFGREIFYQKGSWLVLSQGQNAFGYAMMGYTLPFDLRLGVQAVYGETKMSVDEAGSGKKMELVGETRLKYSKNLDFLAWYSYLHTKNELAKSAKNTVRVQALYKF